MVRKPFQTRAFVGLPCYNYQSFENAGVAIRAVKMHIAPCDANIGSLLNLERI